MPLNGSKIEEDVFNMVKNRCF